MIHSIWQYTVKPDFLAIFQSTYSEHGAWCALFAHAQGYVGTSLLQDLSEPERWLTIDRWESLAHFQAFQTQYSQAYQQLDAHCAHWTETEVHIGIFAWQVPSASGINLPQQCYD